MVESLEEVADRAIKIFNREFSGGGTGVSPETRAAWVAEPVIVPFRAALEGNQYSGATALDDFAAETRESWSTVRIDTERIRVLDGERALVVGELVGRGSETGAETRAAVAFIFVISEGKIAEARTFPSESDALKAVGR